MRKSNFSVVISGVGLYTPKEIVSNEDLVASFNSYVQCFNDQHKAEIAAGKVEPLLESSSAFIEKASGIKSRYVVNRSGVINPERMVPDIPERSNEEMSLQCEISVDAASEALDRANKKPEDVDIVIVACSNMQRPYPAIAIEVQNALKIGGYAYDMNVACSSATFGIQAGIDAILSGSANTVLVVNPEICSGHLDFCDRDSHFIFGDACTAVVLENKDNAKGNHCFEILGTKLTTQFSNNIRNNFGFLNRTDESGIGKTDKLFKQNGRKVFKEVVPMVVKQISSLLSELSLTAPQLRRLWLHQANINMNQLICAKLLGREVDEDQTPTILDKYANTSSAGSIIAFYYYHDDLKEGEIGVISSFGAGYSVGSIVVQKIAL